MDSTLNGHSNGADAHDPIGNAHTDSFKAETAHIHAQDRGTAAPASTGASDTTLATAATVGVVAVGAVILEAALIPGMILGVAAMVAPRVLPKLGSALSPMLRSTVRGVYKLGQ